MHPPLCTFSIEKDLPERYQRGAVCYHNCANLIYQTIYSCNINNYMLLSECIEAIHIDTV